MGNHTKLMARVGSALMVAALGVGGVGTASAADGANGADGCRIRLTVENGILQAHFSSSSAFDGKIAEVYATFSPGEELTAYLLLDGSGDGIGYAPFFIPSSASRVNVKANIHFDETVKCTASRKV